MATSSIFHNVILREPEEIQAFVDAIEASIADPYVRPEGVSVHQVATANGTHFVHEFPNKN